MTIKVEQLSQVELKMRGVMSWLIWTKEASRFPWVYDSIEESYILGGDVTVEAKDGQKVNFGKGYFVTFPKGLSCVWDIKKPMRKHYNFK